MKSSSPSRRRTWFIRIILTGVMAMVIWYFVGRSSEPTHEGKTLTEWLVMATDPFSDESDIAAADKAVRQIGSKTVPTLLDKLAAKDPFWQPIAKPWNWVLWRITPSSWYPNLHINERWAADNHKQALHGFAVLGTNGNSAMPRLSTLLQGDRFALDAAEALKLIHTAEALAALVTGFTNANTRVRSRTSLLILDFEVEDLLPWADQIVAPRFDPDEEVANWAAYLICTLLPEERSVPMLLEMLQDSNPTVQVRALRAFLTGPESGMEAIAQCLPSMAPTNRVGATNVLLFMNVYRAPGFGVKTNRVGEFYFHKQNQRQEEARTNSSSPAPGGTRP